MKTIEETFKAEKEILEEFFKNRKLKIKNEKSYPFMPLDSHPENIKTFRQPRFRQLLIF